MKRVKVKLIGKGTFNDPFRVNLPTYMIDCQRDLEGNAVLTESGAPLDSVDYVKMVCYVLVPEDEVDKEGRLDEKRIREKYKERWSNFVAKDVEEEVVA